MTAESGGDRTLDARPAISLYDGPAPGSEQWTHHERRYFSDIFGTDVVTNVVEPTLTPVVPRAGCGTAVIVAPGGGFHSLSIEREGFDVARRLVEWGVTAFVLKYRLVPSGNDAVAELVAKLAAGGDLADAEMAQAALLATSDAEMAVRLVRSRSAEYGVDPDRVGFIGFSAGGTVAVRVAYAEDDGARPDFVAPIYASLGGFELGPPPGASGPVFVAAATNDPLGLADDAVAIYDRWRASGRMAELHMYAHGGHGFGMAEQGLPSDTWIDRLGDWLTAVGLIPEVAA
jgi:acetyl esterase/lipase